MGALQRAALLLAVVLGLGSLMPHASATSRTERTAETYLLGLVNNERRAAHVGSLKEHGYILGQTEAHSVDMLRRHTMDHNGFSTRVANIRSYDSGIRNGGVCENVAAATNYRDYVAAMRAITAGWKASTDHNKCMLDKFGWSSQSAAAGVRFDGHTYWVTFITARDTNP